MINITEESMKKAEQLQKEMHVLVEEVLNKSNPEMTYQDAFNTVLILKIAELENRIENIAFNSGADE